VVRDLLSSRRAVLRTKLQADASGWPICEAAIENQLRDGEIVDRSVVLRTAERVGVALGRTGRRLRTIPMES